MDIQLKINELALQPGAKVDPDELESRKFQRQGLLKRLVNRLPRDQQIFVADNCTVDCFGEKLSLFPCTHGYLNRDRKWETRASILLVNGKLQRVQFQVLDGVYAAPNIMETFKTICDENFGEGSRTNDNLFTWRNNRLGFTGILQPDNVTADFTIECLND